MIDFRINRKSKWINEKRHWNNENKTKTVWTITAIDCDASGKSQVNLK